MSGENESAMEQAVQAFINYIHRTKGASENTEVSYHRDLSKLAGFLQSECGIEEWDAVTSTDLSSYMLYLEKNHYASSSVSRSVASIRAFFRYLSKRGRILSDPSEELKPPHVEKKAPMILSVEEISRLIAAPDPHTRKGMRDRAMLELLYATGMRVSELIGLKADDVNLELDYVICTDRTKERVIPFNSQSEHALREYLENARRSFISGRDEGYLFTNVQGGKMTRQGFWKLLKGYAAQAGITEEITPHTLRHSFATHMIQNGADMKSLQEMLGHSDISTTQMYAQAGLSHMRDVYRKAHPRSRSRA